MKYLLLICIDPSTSRELASRLPDEERDVDPWVAEMDGRGVRLMGSPVRPASDATTVRVRDGELSLTDGPFAETKEQMAGFDVIECANLDEAIEVASKHPVAKIGMIDIRPLIED
jgi:hypothetical protein